MGKKSKKSKAKSGSNKDEVVIERNIEKSALDVHKDEEPLEVEQDIKVVGDTPQVQPGFDSTVQHESTTPIPEHPSRHVPSLESQPHIVPTTSTAIASNPNLKPSASPTLFPTPSQSDPTFLGTSVKPPIIVSPSLHDESGPIALENVLRDVVETPVEDVGGLQMVQRKEVKKEVEEGEKDAKKEVAKEVKEEVEEVPVFEEKFGYFDQVVQSGTVIGSDSPISNLNSTQTPEKTAVEIPHLTEPSLGSENPTTNIRRILGDDEEDTTSEDIIAVPTVPFPAPDTTPEAEKDGDSSIRPPTPPKQLDSNLFDTTAGDEDSLFLGDTGLSTEFDDILEQEIEESIPIVQPHVHEPREESTDELFPVPTDQEPLFSTDGISEFDDILISQSENSPPPNIHVESQSAKELSKITEFDEEPLFDTTGPSTDLDDIFEPHTQAPDSSTPQESAKELFSSDTILEEPLFGVGGPSTELDDLLAPNVQQSAPEPPVEDVETPFGDGKDAEDEGGLFGAAPMSEFDDLLRGGDEPANFGQAASIDEVEKTPDDLFAGGEKDDWLGPLELSEDRAERSSPEGIQPQPQPQPSGVDSWEDADLDLHGVPEGWLDEAGGWNWYTEDERREVARGMFPDGVDAAVPPPSTSTPVPEPATVSPYSPLSTSTTVDPYAPAPAARQQPQIPTSSYHAAPAAYAIPSAAMAYTSSPTVSANYAPAVDNAYTPPSNPYAPSLAAQAYATTPYAPSPSAAPYVTPSAFPQAPPQKPASKPIERPKQNTAYDPPLLSKPSRSFLRASSSAPLPIMGMAASPANVPHFTSPPPVIAPPPPPGPPRSTSRQAAGPPKHTTYSQPATGFDPPIASFAGPPRSRSVTQPLRNVTSPSTHEATLANTASYPTAPSVAAGPRSGIYRSQSMFPQQASFTPPAPPQAPPSAPLSQFVPQPSSTHLPQAPQVPAADAQPVFPSHRPTTSTSSQDHFAPPAPPAHPPYQVSSPSAYQATPPPDLSQNTFLTRHKDSSTRSSRIEAELDHDSATVAVGKDAHPAVAPHQADEWHGDYSYNSVDDIEDFFGSDGPRRDSAVDSARQQPIPEEQDPEGGALALEDDRPFEDDEEESGPLAQSHQSYHPNAGPNLPLKTGHLQSPQKVRPPITESTFTSPQSQSQSTSTSQPYNVLQTESPNPYTSSQPSEIFVPRPASQFRTMSYAPSLPANDDPYALPHQPSADPAFTPQGNHYEPMQVAGSYSAPTLPPMSSYAGVTSAPIAPRVSFSDPPADAYRNSSTQPIAISDPHADHSAFDQGGTGFSSSYEPPINSEMMGIEEDPLGRAVGAGRRMPTFTFGASGFVVSAFQDAEADEAGLMQPHGYGGPSGSRKVAIRKFGDFIPSTDSSMSVIPFPGPLLFDPAITKGSAADKKKREQVLHFIEDAAKEIEAGLPYLASKGGDAVARAEQEAKVVLLEIIRLMITHEGKVPVSETSGLAELKSVLLRPTSSAMPSTRSNTNVRSDPSGTDRASRASSTEAATLSKLLLAGEQENAVRYAMEEGLWSHALLISSSFGPELWKEVVQKFITDGFGGTFSPSGSEQTLRIAYSMFGGSFATALDTVLPASVHGMAASNAAGEWRNILCTVLTNGKGDPATLSLLGDRLRRAGLLQAAHVCYLLSPQVSPWDVINELNPPKVTLYGSPDGTVNPEALIYSELVEYALSQAPVPKGKDAFSGIPHLLPYKLRKAWQLLEFGNASLARSYCESINTSLRQSKAHPPASSVLVDKLQELSDRMSADGKNDSTLLKKVAKPNLDSIGSWFEGRLTKFIAGEEGSEADPITGKAIAGDSTKQANSAVGPFSHYSTITSGVHGNQMARAASSYDLSGANGLGARMQPSNRTVSAMSHRSPDMEISQYRPSSAHSQRSNTFSGVNFTGIPPPSQPAEERPVFAPRRRSSTASGYGDQIESSLAPVVAMPSWGQSYDFDEATDLGTPTGDAADASNFINPMMAYNTTVAASSTQQASQSSYRPASRQDEEEETVDDLGLGNSARRASPPKPESGDNNENVKTSKPADSAKPTPSEPPKQSGSGRWLGRWWSKTPEGSPTGPIKAKLGDDNAMVYDKELKRWVAKGANGAPEAPKATPPPPRAQTASPAESGMSRLPPQLSMTAPPPRPSSAAPGPPGPPGAPPPLRHQKSALPQSGSAPPQFNKSAAEVAAELMAGPPRKTGSVAGKKKPRYVTID